MENATKLCGTVEGYENISFVLGGFQCIFFNVDSNPKAFTTLPQNQGFILGRTAGQKYVYIYSNEDLKVWNELTLNTWGYFVSSSPDITSYKAICFEGGILNKLFFQSSIIVDYTDTGAERIENCFFEFQPLMGEYISRKQIDELVKYRNTITHGSFMPLDNKIAETAFVLMELVYCCILKRIGLTDKVIKDLFKRHLIS